MSINRIPFVTAVAVGAVCLAGAAVATALPAHAASELKACHFLPPNHTAQKALVAWGEELAQKSNGELKLTIYPAGQLGGGANRQFDAARNGICDLSFSLHGATPGRYAITELASLPFIGPSGEVTSALMSRRLTELAPEYLAEEHQGLKILWMAVTPRLMFFSKEPIRSVEDFNGLKVRYAGVQFKNLIDALDAVPLPVPPPETTDAMSKGIIDAATFPFEGASSFDLGTVARYGLQPGVASASFALVMNPNSYDRLPDDLKALIDETTGPDAAEAYGASWDSAEVEGKEKLLAKGVELIVLPDAELAKVKAIAEPQVQTAVKAVDDAGKPGTAFLDAYTK